MRSFFDSVSFLPPTDFDFVPLFVSYVIRHPQHFKHLKRRGVYVDIATNEPVRISNTYFYDACLQWRGLCVEAHPGYINLIKRMRSCAITPACVGEKEGNVTFVLDAGGSGVLETNKNAAAVAKKDRISVRCVKTKDAIMAAGITVIDLLSLDVEGYELNVLKGIDWTKTRINVIVIESLSEETKALLHGLGYTRANQPQTGEEKKKPGNIFSDFVYLHPDVVWGKPV